MYKILIADDESMAREGLINSINWQTLGITEIEQAEDGQEAIKKALEFMPDIILSDVRMPNMDGIEFVNYIRKQLPYTQIIFISGYSEKDYLKAAIRLEAIEYLEKPYEKQDMLSALNKALQRIENYKADKEQRIVYSVYLQEQKRRDMERLSREMVDVKISESISALILETGICFKKDGYYVSAVIRINFSHFTSAIQREDIRERVLNELWEEASKANGQIICGYYDYDTIAVHCCTDSKSNVEHFNNFIKLANLRMKESLSVETLFSIGIGEMTSGIENVRTSFASAVKASFMQYFHEGSNIFLWEGTNENKCFHLSGHWNRKILLAVETGSEVEVVQLLESLTEEICEYDQSDIKYIKNIYFNILIKFFERHSNIHLAAEEQEYEWDYFWEAGLKAKNLKGLRDFIINEIKVLVQYKNSNSEAVHNDVVTKIKGYINENYMNDLTIKEIAEYVYLTHTYICLLFKRDTGITINNFITECRIKKAIELLGVQKYSLYEIAEKTGFNDYKYFSKVFKKITGLSPLEFRERASS